MLDSLLIRNFRLFSEFKVDRLARVNLIAGGNNSGKTCLLEALRVYAGKATPEVLDVLLSERAEYWEMRLGTRLQRRGAAYPMQYLFRGRRFPAPEQEGVEIGPIGGSQRLSIRTTFYQLNEQGGLSRLHIDPQSPPEGLDLATVGLALELTYGGYPPRLFPLSADPESTPLPPRPLSEYFWGEQLQPALYVPARGQNDARMLVSLWDQVSLTNLEQHVIEALRIIEPQVSGLAFFGESEERIPVVRLHEGERRLPLSHLGSGMTQVLYVVLNLVNAHDGFLLIDEFETGLHWSILAKLWETVFTLAEQLNVQVFATTHSRDCIRTFAAAWKQHPAPGGLYRLEQDPKHGARVHSETLDTLPKALETKL